MLCAIDIDGVLNDYPDCWVNYLNEALGTEYADLNEAKANVPFAIYNYAKEKYRSSGIKEMLPVKPDAKQLMRVLKSYGYIIVIMTSRPIYQNQNVFEQTVRWLKKNGLPYDDLFFTDKKNMTIAKYFPNIEFVIEDNRKNANEIAAMGKPVFLMDNKYNQGELFPLVTRVKDLEEVCKIIVEVNENARKQ